MDCSLPVSSVHGILQQEYWSVLPWFPPGDLLNVGIEPWSPALQADSLLSEPPGKPVIIHQMLINYSCQNTEFESERPASYKYQFASIIKDRCIWINAMTLKVLAAQSCLTLCDSMDCNPPGSLVHGILQARILEWISIPFSRGSSWPKDQTLVSCITGVFFTISRMQNILLTNANGKMMRGSIDLRLHQTHYMELALFWLKEPFKEKNKLIMEIKYYLICANINNQFITFPVKIRNKDSSYPYFYSTLHWNFYPS